METMLEGMVVHTLNPSTWEIGSLRPIWSIWQILGHQLGIHSDTVSKKGRDCKNNRTEIVRIEVTHIYPAIKSKLLRTITQR